MSTPIIHVVTGANRGLGLGLVRHILARDPTHVVVATCRDRSKAAALEELRGKEGSGRLHIVGMEIVSGESVEAAAAEIASKVPHIDVLVNNAGVIGAKSNFVNTPIDAFVETFKTNTVGPIQVTRALLPLLRRGTRRQVVAVSSWLGSIAGATWAGCTEYRMSKAALNM
ncbi:hypothetical protein BDK51DRAFT_25459, partial [Blyttiomyces helicus]